ncbi:uncharacterized protein NECHADRAFT_88345 [Fusarium vanettenii 77-13-4]|uniref:C2H2-type domain-containing protein n=1 Tax=Fusarium vanettenii (strain ATCC MYA-4622 / CBS 123669 / FGSC 9596 / NRRL 45880 / 77-13-4) TaxID=660122 RepID=C7ZNC1_FUSV7|nr:uncharacterized protein NECHADRAFT_88345 [Fusarium vanettenii 77-13-4]EEU34506.1 hypothetical protein NECHADRAFT_88345 [Fusarium vanettenii 77-13-4]
MPSQLQPLGLVSCPYCGTACRGSHGIKTHSAKIHGIEGRKRLARTPSPQLQRPTRRQRQLQPNSTLEEPTLDRPASRESYRSFSSYEERGRPSSPRSLSSSSSCPSTPSHRPSSQGPTLEPLEEYTLEPLGPLEEPTLELETREPREPRELTLEPEPRELTLEPEPRELTLEPEPKEPTLEGPTLEQLHNQAIAPILAKASMQKLLAFARIPIPEKRLHARQAAIFTATAHKAAAAFLKRPTEKALLYFLILPRLLGLGLQKGGLATLLRSFPSNLPTLESLESLQQPPEPPKAARPSIAPSPAQRAAKLLERGYLGRAARALIDPTPIAPNSVENRARLLEKHPIGSKDPFQGKTRPRAGQPITSETIIAAIASIGKEKAPGLSGWTRPLLDLVTRKDSPVIAFLRLLADMIRQGTAPGAHLLCASRLIGLEKPDGGVRPIAIGDLIYRVAMKAILMTSYRPNMLLPFQLGVNSPGGVEPAIFLLYEAIIGLNEANFQQLASIDLANAFNSVDRASIAASVATFAPTFYKAAAWAYNDPSILVMEDGSAIASAKGAPQGTLEAAKEVLKGSPFSLNLAKSKEKAIEDLKLEGLKALGRPP